MLLGISWWAGLYILLILLIVTLELKGLGAEDDDDESSPFFDYIILITRYVYYASLIVLTVMFFNTSDSQVYKWVYIGAAIYTLPFGVWFTATEIKDFVFNPTGKDEETGEENGLVSNAIGYSIPLTLYGGGLAFAITGSLPLV